MGTLYPVGATKFIYSTSLYYAGAANLGVMKHAFGMAFAQRLV